MVAFLIALVTIMPIVFRRCSLKTVQYYLYPVKLFAISVYSCIDYPRCRVTVSRLRSCLHTVQGVRLRVLTCTPGPACTAAAAHAQGHISCGTSGVIHTSRVERTERGLEHGLELELFMTCLTQVSAHCRSAQTFTHPASRHYGRPTMSRSTGVRRQAQRRQASAPRPAALFSYCSRPVRKIIV